MVKVDIIFHYEVDENTGEMTYIGKDQVEVDTKKTSSRTSTKKAAEPKAPAKDESKPIITLESNKLVLTQAAVDLLEVCPDCRIDIKYKKKDKQSVPVIGTDAAFDTKAGNKLTKSNTVSYRGAANEKLAQYGTEFTLEPTEDKGIYYLIGNSAPGAPEDIPEEVVNITDDVDIEEELDGIDFNEIEDQDIEQFDFKL